MASKTDRYSNKFYGTVTESAANTLTFAEIQTNLNTFSKIAWTLSRLEWFLSPSVVDLIGAADDTITMALVASNKMSSLDLSDPAVIDYFELGMKSFSGAGFNFWESPMIRELGTLPGGGLLIAPRPLYLAIQGTSLASAATVECRGYFTQQELSDAEYIELVDFYRILA